MKLIFTLAMAFIFQSSLFSQKGKAVTEYYYKELKKSEGKVDRNGMKNGLWKFWDYDGNLIETLEFKNDLLNGEKLVEEENFKISGKLEVLKTNEKIYLNALKRQKVSQLDTIVRRIKYKNGKRHGYSISYDKTGNLNYECNFINDKENGLCKIFNEHSKKLHSFTYYTLGKIDSSFHFDNNGIVIRKSYVYEKRILIYNYENEILLKKDILFINDERISSVSCIITSSGENQCDTVFYKISKNANHSENFVNDSQIVYINNNDNEEGKIEIVEVKIKEAISTEEEIFDVVEEKPQFPGGNTELYKFIGTNFTMDSTMKSQAIAGKIYVSFVIDKDGSVTQAKVLKGLSAPLDNEALRVVNLMPKWIPGKQRGKEVKVRYNLPIVMKYN